MASNTAATGPDAFGGFANATFSLIGDDSNSTLVDAGDNLIGNSYSPIDPGLGQLSDNGGPTPTHRPLSGSLVVDAGAAFSTTDFDQRDFGFDRLVNRATDIGALELQTNYDVIDFSGDGQIDGNNIDLLIDDIATGPADPAIFDLNGDGQVNLADRDVWLALAGAANLPSGNPYLVSDANLDGVVDISDFNLWNANKFTADGGWTQGDFNADGVTDVSDFNLWNTFEFQASDTANRAMPQEYYRSYTARH